MEKKPTPVTLNLRLLGESIYYRWQIVLIPLVILPMAMVVFGELAPKKYKATAQVLVQESISVNPFLEDMQVPWTVQQRLPVIQAILRSRLTLEKVLKEFGEIDETTTPKQIDISIAALRKQISVDGMGGGLINIAFVGNQPERIYRTLKHLVDDLIDAMLRPQKQSLEDASQFLEKQLTDVRASLLDIEAKIEKFRQDHVEELPEVFSANLQAYVSNQGSLLQAQTDLRAARMRQRNLEQRLKVYNPVARGLEASLIEARTRLGELNAIYTPDHPEIVALKAHIKQLTAERKNANLKGGKLDIAALESAASLQTGVATNTQSGTGVENRPADIVTSDLLEYKSISAEIASLQGAVSSLKKHGSDTINSVKSVATTERVLQELMRDHEVKQNTYTNLLAKYEESRVTKALSMYDEDKQIVLIEAPRKPTKPIGITGEPLVLAALGLAVGLLFGVTIIIFQDFISGTIRSIDELETLTGKPTMGVMPRIYDFSSKKKASGSG